MRAVQRRAEAGSQDAVLLTVKAQQVGELPTELRDLSAPRTALVTMINGIPCLYFHELAGPSQGAGLGSASKMLRRNSFLSAPMPVPPPAG